jgi:hypothetical protein
LTGRKLTVEDAILQQERYLIREGLPRFPRCPPRRALIHTMIAVRISRVWKIAVQQREIITQMRNDVKR